MLCQRSDPCTIYSTISHASYIILQLMMDNTGTWIYYRYKKTPLLSSDHIFFAFLLHN